MSLLRKFAILLGLFALTVGAGLGAAFAFGVVLERDVAGPFRDATEALGDLSRLKRSLAGLQEAIDDGAGGYALEVVGHGGSRTFDEGAEETFALGGRQREEDFEPEFVAEASRAFVLRPHRLPRAGETFVARRAEDLRDRLR